MLLIDGVKYLEWTPKSEEEFEQIVSEHTSEIFGEQSIYLDRKQKLRSLSGIGSIPDGYVITFGDSSHWHIVEVELSSHPLHDHIVAQVGRFIGGIENLRTQNNLVKVIYDEIINDDFFKLRLRKSIGLIDTHRFLTDLISKPPMLTIIIEKASPELSEALKILRYPQEIKVVEFQTFIREGVGLQVHAHLFEPLHKRVITPEPKISSVTPAVSPSVKREIASKVTFQELVSAGLLVDGQVLYFYNTRPFKDERAKVIASSNQLQYEVDGRIYSKSELAKQLLIKHGFKHDEHGVAGPKYWKTADGKLLVDLEEQVRSLRGDRG